MENYLRSDLDKRFRNVIELLLMSILLLCNGACKKEEVYHSPFVYPTNTDVIKLDTIWQTAFNKDGSYVKGIPPMFNSEGNILMSNWGNSPREVFKLYHSKTGKLLWEWSDYLRDEDIFSPSSIVVQGDYIVLANYNATYCFNMVTGKTQWKHYSDTMYGSYILTKGVDGYIYHSFNGEIGRNAFYIFRTKPESLNWELVFTYIDSTKTYDNFFTKFATSFHDANGDHLIYGMENAGNSVGPSQLCNLNLATKKLDWSISYSPHYSEFQSPQPVLTDKYYILNAIKGMKRFLTAIHISDGTIAWEKEVEEWGMGLFQYGNKVISTYNTLNLVKAYDITTGQELWSCTLKPIENEIMGFKHFDSQVCSHYLITNMNNSLIAIDLNNGTEVFAKYVLPSNRTFDPGLAIDIDNHIAYAADNLFGFAFKLPKEITY